MTHLNEYQNSAMATAVYPIDRGLDYLMSGLAGEVGELTSLWAKAIRDHEGAISDERRADMLKEAGDCLWFIAGIARELDAPLEVVGQTNLNKLASRKARGKLQGSGDHR
jgi:NTP pyrophosphatase (non-canonical NTP hydrolase)